MVVLNKTALKVVDELVSRLDEVKVAELSVAGARVFDCGVNVEGSFEAGVYVSRICLAGLASISLSTIELSNIVLPQVNVYTDYPVESCMLSQYAGWKISVGDYTAMGSGPARALARKPKKLYEEVGFVEESDEAVLALEAPKLPTEDAVKFIAQACSVKPSNLTLLAFSTNSMAGSVQISARIVETGIHKLHSLGFPLKAVKRGVGSCPIAPLHPDPSVMMGRANDMLLLAGKVYLAVEYHDLEKLREHVEKTPSSSSRQYGKPFYEIYKEAGCDFYKIDPNLFAPALITVFELSTGIGFKAGHVDAELLKKSLGL